MTQTLGAAIAAHINTHQTLGKDWPTTAEYGVEVRYKTWPTYSGDWRVCFFDTREELLSWLAEQREWARLEDNYFEYVAYQWDWGPQIIDV